ncbi:MAG: winged helix-turn-helix transcriptional regulator [Azonexaceae bacterium]|jgi:hypothetical protein|nr:winged helix-turn-helix transcriptional regulator [Azonexaceae bacterium]
MKKFTAQSQSTFDHIVKALLEAGEMTAADLVKLLGMRNSTLQKFLVIGVTMGQLNRVQLPGGKTRPFVYFLTDAGIKYAESLIKPKTKTAKAEKVVVPEPVEPAIPEQNSAVEMEGSEDFRKAIRLIAKPFALAVAKEVANTVSDLGVEIFVEELLREIPAQLVVKSVERLRTLDIESITTTTTEMVAALVRPKKLRVSVTGMTAEDEAKLRKEFEKEFTFEFVPSNDLAWILRAGEHADHVVLITGRPNVESANARFKELGKTPMLVSGGYKEVSDRLTDLYLESVEAI